MDMKSAAQDATIELMQRGHSGSDRVWCLVYKGQTFPFGTSILARQSAERILGRIRGGEDLTMTPLDGFNRIDPATLTRVERAAYGFQVYTDEEMKMSAGHLTVGEAEVICRLLVAVRKIETFLDPARDRDLQEAIGIMMRFSVEAIEERTKRNDEAHDRREG